MSYIDIWKKGKTIHIHKTYRIKHKTYRTNKNLDSYNYQSNNNLFFNIYFTDKKLHALSNLTKILEFEYAICIVENIMVKNWLVLLVNFSRDYFALWTLLLYCFKVVRLNYEHSNKIYTMYKLYKKINKITNNNNKIKV